ncbi:MAG: MarR family transcriptional regulator [Firmicutes bacterium]|nr:MarR family transcriptional regulator [Bacillota bacterium]
MDKDSLLKLDNQLCFAVYACAKEITGLYRPILDTLGLTYTQYITLLVLWEKDDVTLKELGERLLLNSGTLTPLLKKMEAAGILFRERSKDDERNLRIRLTDKGRELKKAAYEIPEKVFCASHLTMEEATLLRNKLKELLTRLSVTKR